MKTFHVDWEIDLDAETPEDAAQQALAIQRNPASIATVFDVIEFETNGEAVRVDLSEQGDDPNADNVAALLHLAVTEEYLYCSCGEEEGCPEDECNYKCDCVYGRSVRALKALGYEV